MRRLVGLATVFVLLLGVWLLKSRQESRVITRGAVDSLTVKADQVTRVRIHRSDSDIELAKSGSDWRLAKPIDQPADGQQVQGMLSALKSVKLEDVISTNKAKRGMYQVDSTGTQVEVWTGGDKPVLSLVVGKSSPDWTHTYVRRTNEDKVYRAEGVLTYNFNKKADDWRDKTILKLEEPTITRIALEYPKEKLDVVLARADSAKGWTFAAKGGAPEKGDSLSVARLVSQAARLSTVGFATPQEAAGKDFASPDFRLRVTAEGETHTVSFVPQDEQKMLARKEGSETVFSLYKGSLTNLMKKPEDLRKKAPGAVTPVATPTAPKRPATAKKPAAKAAQPPPQAPAAESQPTPAKPPQDEAQKP